MTREEIKAIITDMTLEEKAGLCSGADFWRTKAVERLAVPAMMVSDGPHGLRKQADEGDHLGLTESIKAVCFPAGCATAASFDRNLVRRLGELIGTECQAEDVGVILGPAINIKRSPLCGRNFEYYSEDPCLAGEMAASFVSGVQSRGVGTSVKHYLANNQEHRRMTSSSEIDDRTLREIYLTPFETVVKKAKPWTMMCSYNKINGTYAAENEKYLTGILRDEWDFEGFVMSDWGAVNDRVEGLKAGLELEMPASGGINDEKIIAAVKSGELEERVLDQAVERLLTIIFAYQSNRNTAVVFDRDKDHAEAERIEEECAVLLKNDGCLPLDKNRKTAFIGKFAVRPRYQGGGSSHINTDNITSAYDSAKAEMPVIYAQGYRVDEDRTDEELVREAVKVAKEAEVAVIFAGLPDSFESEGYDRKHMHLPDCQNHLIREILKVQKECIVVLHNGSPVEMPWADEVKGILEMYLGGEGVGAAAYRILYGEVNPSGRLPETFPMRLSDNPSYLYYTGEGDKVEYREGVFVGYRYYDKKEIAVRFPFGYGLSYTTFAYSGLTVTPDSIDQTAEVEVTASITNTGRIKGKEVVQLYVGKKDSRVIRPAKELRDFVKVELEPGEMKTVTFILDSRAFSYFDTDRSEWYAESGTYEIMLGRSSAEIVQIKEIELKNTDMIRQHYHINSTLGDILKNPQAKSFLEPLIARIGIFNQGEPAGEDSVLQEEMMTALMADMPMRAILSFAAGEISREEIEDVLAQMNRLSI